ncbi:MAG: response regulator [Oscillospiraceae bacterium]
MIRAVICDDETAAQTIIRYFIKSEGLPIEIVGTASNGQSALELIRQEQPDLAFLDIQMPALNGFEVIEQLHNCNTKIIVITVYDTFSYAQKALRLGVRDILSKPIDIAQLRQAIIRAIGWNFTPNDTLNQALSYIHLHYAEKIEIVDLAQDACCTTSHIAHLFKKYLDISPVTYINKVRIDQAVQMLHAGESIKETAYGVGYKSLNNFYKHFKFFTGKTPASFLR